MREASMSSHLYLCKLILIHTTCTNLQMNTAVHRCTCINNIVDMIVSVWLCFVVWNVFDWYV